MKYIVNTPFFDINEDKNILVGDIIEINEDRKSVLNNKGIFLSEFKEEKSLIDLFNEDRNIIDTLNLKELKKLCKDLDVRFTNEDEIREHLKTMESLEDK